MRRFGIAATLAVALVGCTGAPSGVQPVRDFEAERYLGKWYEIKRLDHSFERGLSNVTATYTEAADGKIGVVNRGYDADDCGWRDVEGDAVFQGDRSVASLSVTFFWPFAGGYHVIALDQDDYGYALVAGPTRDYLWILAREPELAPDIVAELEAVAAANGFAVDELITVAHGPPECQPKKS